MPTGFERLCADLCGSVVFLLLSTRFNSLMMISAWRWSGSYVMPESVQRSVRFRTRISFSIPSSGPNNIGGDFKFIFHFSAYPAQGLHSASDCGSRLRALSRSALFVCERSLHGDARPDLKPILSRNSVYSRVQFCAASRVPYRLKFNRPTMCSSPDSKSSIGISIYTGLRDRA